MIAEHTSCVDGVGPYGWHVQPTLLNLRASCHELHDICTPMVHAASIQLRNWCPPGSTNKNAAHLFFRAVQDLAHGLPGLTEITVDGRDLPERSPSKTPSSRRLLSRIACGFGSVSPPASTVSRNGFPWGEFTLALAQLEHVHQLALRLAQLAQPLGPHSSSVQPLCSVRSLVWDWTNQWRPSSRLAGGEGRGEGEGDALAATLAVLDHLERLVLLCAAMDATPLLKVVSVAQLDRLTQLEVYVVDSSAVQLAPGSPLCMLRRLRRLTLMTAGAEGNTAAVSAISWSNVFFGFRSDAWLLDEHFVQGLLELSQLQYLRVCLTANHVGEHELQPHPSLAELEVVPRGQGLTRMLLTWLSDCEKLAQLTLQAHVKPRGPVTDELVVLSPRCWRLMAKMAKRGVRFSAPAVQVQEDELVQLSSLQGVQSLVVLDAHPQVLASYVEAHAALRDVVALLRAAHARESLLPLLRDLTQLKQLQRMHMQVDWEEAVGESGGGDVPCAPGPAPSSSALAASDAAAFLADVRALCGARAAHCRLVPLKGRQLLQVCSHGPEACRACKYGL